MSESGMENTTQQLQYVVDEPTTQGQIPVPAVPPAAPPVEAASGRVPVAGAPATQAVPQQRREAGRGRTTIADDVVERVIQKVVDLAVEEIDGVHRLRPGVDRFIKGADTDDAADDEGEGRAVAVELSGGQATINLSIEVDFGHAVHEVVDQVRNTVIGSAEKLLGMTVAEVNVWVSDVSFPEPVPGT